jgi:hypothetical protein
MLLGSADEQKPAAEGTVEAWARSPNNPVGGWYGLKKGLRGRFACMCLPCSRNWDSPRWSRIRATIACALSSPQRAGRGPHGSQTNGSCESATQAPFCRRLPTSHAKGRSRPSRFTNKRVVRVRDPGSVLRAFLRSKGLCWSKREGRIQSAERAMPTHSN